MIFFPVKDRRPRLSSVFRAPGKTSRTRGDDRVEPPLLLSEVDVAERFVQIGDRDLDVTAAWCDLVDASGNFLQQQRVRDHELARHNE